MLTGSVGHALMSRAKSGSVGVFPALGVPPSARLTSEIVVFVPGRGFVRLPSPKVRGVTVEQRTDAADIPLAVLRIRQLNAVYVERTAQFLGLALGGFFCLLDAEADRRPRGGQADMNQPASAGCRCIR